MTSDLPVKGVASCQQVVADYNHPVLCLRVNSTLILDFGIPCTRLRTREAGHIQPFELPHGGISSRTIPAPIIPPEQDC